MTQAIVPLPPKQYILALLSPCFLGRRAWVWPIATDVAHSVVCVSVCLCVGHTGELCKIGWTDWDAVWGLTHVDPRNHVLHGVQIPHGKGQFWGGHVLTHHSILTAGKCVCGGRMHSLPRGVIRGRCGLLPNYFGYLLSASMKSQPILIIGNTKIWHQKIINFYLTSQPNLATLPWEIQEVTLRHLQLQLDKFWEHEID